jgi:hypothetical protein
LLPLRLNLLCLLAGAEAAAGPTDATLEARTDVDHKLAAAGKNSGVDVKAGEDDEV